MARIPPDIIAMIRSRLHRLWRQTVWSFVCIVIWVNCVLCQDAQEIKDEEESSSGDACRCGRSVGDLSKRMSSLETVLSRITEALPNLSGFRDNEYLRIRNYEQHLRDFEGVRDRQNQIASSYQKLEEAVNNVQQQVKQQLDNVKSNLAKTEEELKNVKQRDGVEELQRTVMSRLENTDRKQLDLFVKQDSLEIQQSAFEEKYKKLEEKQLQLQQKVEEETKEIKSKHENTIAKYLELDAFRDLQSTQIQDLQKNQEVMQQQLENITLQLQETQKQLNQLLGTQTERETEQKQLAEAVESMKNQQNEVMKKQSDIDERLMNLVSSQQDPSKEKDKLVADSSEQDTAQLQNLVIQLQKNITLRQATLEKQQKEILEEHDEFIEQLQDIVKVLITLETQQTNFTNIQTEFQEELYKVLQNHLRLDQSQKEAMSKLEELNAKQSEILQEHQVINSQIANITDLHERHRAHVQDFHESIRKQINDSTEQQNNLIASQGSSVERYEGLANEVNTIKEIINILDGRDQNISSFQETLKEKLIEAFAKQDILEMMQNSTVQRVETLERAHGSLSIELQSLNRNTRSAINTLEKLEAQQNGLQDSMHEQMTKQQEEFKQQTRELLHNYGKLGEGIRNFTNNLLEVAKKQNATIKVQEQLQERINKLQSNQESLNTAQKDLRAALDAVAIRNIDSLSEQENLELQVKNTSIAQERLERQFFNIVQDQIKLEGKLHLFELSVDKQMENLTMLQDDAARQMEEINSMRESIENLKDVRNVISNLENQQSNLTARQVKLEGDMEMTLLSQRELEEKQAKTGRKLDTLESRQGDLVTEQAYLKFKVYNITNIVGDIRREYSNVMQNVTVLEMENKDFTEKMDDLFGNITKRHTVVENTIKDLENKYSALNEKNKTKEVPKYDASHLEDYFANITTRQDVINRTLKDIEDRILNGQYFVVVQNQTEAGQQRYTLQEKLDEYFNNVTSRQNAINDALENLETRYQFINTQFNNMLQTQIKLDGQQNNFQIVLRDYYNNITRRQDMMEQGLTDLEQKYHLFNEKQNAVARKQIHLENQQNNLNSRIVEYFNNLTARQNLFLEDIKYLRDKLFFTNMTAMFKSLSELGDSELPELKIEGTGRKILSDQADAERLTSETIISDDVFDYQKMNLAARQVIVEHQLVTLIHRQEKLELLFEIIRQRQDALEKAHRSAAGKKSQSTSVTLPAFLIKQKSSATELSQVVPQESVTQETITANGKTH